MAGLRGKVSPEPRKNLARAAICGDRSHGGTTPTCAGWTGARCVMEARTPPDATSAWWFANGMRYKYAGAPPNLRRPHKFPEIYCSFINDK